MQHILDLIKPHLRSLTSPIYLQTHDAYGLVSAFNVLNGMKAAKVKVYQPYIEEGFCDIASYAGSIKETLDQPVKKSQLDFLTNGVFARHAVQTYLVLPNVILNHEAAATIKNLEDLRETSDGRHISQLFVTHPLPCPEDFKRIFHTVLVDPGPSVEEVRVHVTNTLNALFITREISEDAMDPYVKGLSIQQIDNVLARAIIMDRQRKAQMNPKPTGVAITLEGVVAARAEVTPAYPMNGSSLN